MPPSARWHLNGVVSLAPIADETVASPAPRRSMTRRQVLAAAAATGIGVGVIRLLGGSMQEIASPRHGSGTDWLSPLQSESARLMQLLRRSTFGYTPAQLDSAMSDGFNKTVDRLLETKPAEPPAPRGAASLSRSCSSGGSTTHSAPRRRSRSE
jgi:hypothetical protein